MTEDAAPKEHGGERGEERGERIAKWAARAGVASRRDVEKMIAEGRIKLNGVKLGHPASFVTEGDIVQVDGRVVDAPARTRLFRYHKPVGLMTTHKDPEGRPTVFEKLPPGLPRLISVAAARPQQRGAALAHQ
jgi:23S rRNA pseudouridine2605 synthase